MAEVDRLREDHAREMERIRDGQAIVTNRLRNRIDDLERDVALLKRQVAIADERAGEAMRQAEFGYETRRP